MDQIHKVMRPIIERLGATAQEVAPPVTASRGDSVLEERFWSLIDETVGGRDGSLDQFEIGSHRVDSIFLVRQGAIVIELDGAAYHKDYEADRRRDYDILRSVTGVIRIRYYDLMNFPRSTMYSLSRFYERFTVRKMFEDYDNPNTANMLGIIWRGGVMKPDARIIRRIQEGKRCG